MSTTPSTPRRVKSARQRPHRRAGASVAVAYDLLAPTYNRKLKENLWMREVLWRHYERIFRPGDRVLDVACGTGLDALFLARRGVRVTGIDLSAGMIEHLQDDAGRLGLHDRVQARVGDVADLGDWPGGYFHGVISSFAGLNTVPDLSAFAADASRLLLPRGRLVAHFLAPGDLWQRRKRARRHGRVEAEAYFRQRKRTVVIAGHPVKHRVITSTETYRRYFAPHFILRQRYGLGILMAHETAAQVPLPLARLLGRFEKVLGLFRLFRSRCRFFVLDLENRIDQIDVGPPSRGWEVSAISGPDTPYHGP